MLRIMFLNTWGGELWEDFRNFLINNKVPENFDVFCFSEVHRLPDAKAPFIVPTLPGSRKNAIYACQYDALKDIISEHDGYHSAHGEYLLHDLERADVPIRYGNAMFISNKFPHFFYSDMAFRQFNKINDGKPAGRTIQGAIIYHGGDIYIVAHFHGIWTGGHKNDTDERLEQSRQVNTFLNHLAEKCRKNFGVEPKVILGGDFNLNSDTESLKIITRSEAFNGKGRVLNWEFSITDTRTHYYTKEVREADFVIVSENVKVHSFSAPAEPAVSDHCPLIISCE